MMPNPDLSKFKNKEFRILNIAWNVYDIDGPDAKGTLRVLGFPIYVLEVPPEYKPPGSSDKPMYALQVQYLVSFINLGEKGTPNNQPLSVQDLSDDEKIDITSSALTGIEPFSEFLVPMGKGKNVLLRLKTTLMKVEVIKDKTNFLGDPILMVQSTTSQSTSEYKESSGVTT